MATFEHGVNMTTDDIRWLRDRVEIHELLARYCDRLDAHDLDGVAATFTEDATTNYGPGRGGNVVGRVAIRERIAHGQSAFRRTHHQVGHSTITVAGSSGTGVSATLTWHERFTGERELLALRYIDEYRRIDDDWLISRRRVDVSMVDGFEGTTWNWWERRDPEYPVAPT